MEDVRIHPAPHQPGGPPIIVAGRQEPAMRRAATLGDGWMPYLYSPRRYAESVRTIRETAAATGRDLDGFGWYAFVFVTIDDDGERARERAAGGMGGIYKQDFTAMVDHVAVAGTADEVTEKLSAFVDAGARAFVFSPVTTPDATEVMVHQLVEEVMPGVQAHANSLTSR
jgi:alkanesulfonate monooxygenase SsuD/methylene tetrahydromethanopterin reductase-like flavin-dependent oxidoreductase (luciferase family)